MSTLGKAVKNPKHRHDPKTVKSSKKEKGKQSVVKHSLSPAQMQKEKSLLFRLLSTLSLTLSPSYLKAGNIPFNWAKFLKGTQYPTLRLYLQSVDVTLVASTDHNTVRSLTAAALLNFANLAVVFDEYRFVDAEFEYFSTRITSGTSSIKALGVIDYVDSTALASIDAATAFDTKRWFNVPTQDLSYGAPAKSVKWRVALEPLPDQEWIAIGTTNIAVANWKPYIVNGGTTAGICGHIEGWADVQFRNSI